MEFQEQVTTINNGIKGKERGGEESGSACFFEGVRWENLGPSEDGEEGINQDEEAGDVEGRA